MLLLLKLLETVIQRQLLLLTALLLEQQVLKLVEVRVLLLLFVLHTHCVFYFGWHQVGLLRVSGHSLRDLEMSGLSHKGEFLFVL